MIVTRFRMLRCTVIGLQKHARIEEPGKLIEGEDGELIFEGFTFHVHAGPWTPPIECAMAVQALAVAYATEQAHYVELDCGGESDDVDFGEEWKKG